MKILVSTKLTQGRRANDFSFVPEGEPVKRGLVCGRDKYDGPDGGCGCGRALVGTRTSKSTTTVRVADDPDATLESLAATVLAAWQREGWVGAAATQQDRDRARFEASWNAGSASAFQTGAVLEYRGEVLAQRTDATPAN